jgi:hypothetical protein
LAGSSFPHDLRKMKWRDSSAPRLIRSTQGTFKVAPDDILPFPSPSSRTTPCPSSQMATGLLWIAAGLVPLSATSVRAQVTCENYGSPINSSACACPPGFGGSTCSAPACGGNIFQEEQRPLVSGASATSYGNLSSSACACPTGWTGTGCNVCQAPTVCQSAFNAAGGNSSSTSDPLQSGLNTTLTCNTESRVWAAGEMSCAVIVRSLTPLCRPLRPDVA